MASLTTTGGSQYSHRQVAVILSGLLLGMLLAALDTTILSTALPTVVGELGGLDNLSWVITAYLLTSTVTVPIYGKLSDLYGRKGLFQLAVIIFIVGSVLAGASQNMMQLIIFRAVQGIGAGGIMALPIAIMGDIVSPRERGRYQGYFGTVFGLSSIAGPLLGGFFVDQLSWRWVFYINVPLGLIALLVTAVALHVPHTRSGQKVDYAGMALMVAGVSCLLLVAAWGGGEYAWLSPTIIGLLGASIALLGLFVLQEIRAPEPMFPLRLFGRRAFSLGTSILFISNFGMMGATAFLPIHFQVVMGVSATNSGLRMIPMMAGWVGSSVIGGRMISNTGRYRLLPIMGMGLVTIGLLLLSTLDGGTGMAQTSAYMLVLGLGVGMTMPVVVLSVQNDSPHRDMGTATAGANFFRSMGGAFGVAVFGSVLASRLDYHLPRLVPSESLGGLESSALLASPEQLRALPPAALEGVIAAFSQSLEVVFLAAAPIAFLAFLLALLVKEMPLREQAHVGFDEERYAETVAAGSPGEGARTGLSPALPSD